MNNTTKAKYDMAEKMLKGRIEVDEVVLMTGLPKEDIEKLKKELDDKNPANKFEGMDVHDLNIGSVIFDDYDDLDSSDGSGDSADCE